MVRFYLQGDDLNYHPDDFLALTDEVERQGGFIQPDPCMPTEFRRRFKDGTWKRDHTAGCGYQARFGVSYDPTDPVYFVSCDDHGNRVVIDHPGEKVEGTAYIAVCAVDDDMGRWPRFQNVIEEDSY